MRDNDALHGEVTVPRCFDRSKKLLHTEQILESGSKQMTYARNADLGKDFLTD